VTIKSRGTSDFWRLYGALPSETKSVARKNYRLWQANPFHPSLHFKPLGKPNWSIRLGDHYRAIGKFSGDSFLWEWVGTHAEYDKRF
jgi:hypothetical protein